VKAAVDRNREPVLVCLKVRGVDRRPDLVAVRIVPPVNKNAALSCKRHRPWYYSCGRRAKLLLLIALFFVPFPFLLVAVAQTPTSPGSGNGYLIDKHVGAGLACASCHRDAPPPKAPEMTVCTGCHGTYLQIAAKTASDQPNPHASHLGQIPCAACHHVHRASESLCDQCHTFGMKPP
jgi:fumarate reductase flavoprotein subunit